MENNANFDGFKQTANFDEVQFFNKTYTLLRALVMTIHVTSRSKLSALLLLLLIIFGTHNLQIFKHNTLINELLLMQFTYLCLS